MVLSEKDKIEKLQSKINSVLTENDMVFLIDYIHKHWYKNLYNVLWFELTPIFKRVSTVSTK